MDMVYSGAGLKLTESFESLRLKAYRDQKGVWTCGWGHTRGVGPSTTCTAELAEQWLQQDVKIAVDAVNRLVKVALSQGEFDALVDFVFNLGETKFSKSTMLDLLNSGNHKGAAEQFERWKYCDGKEVAGLLRRRIAERDEFKGG